MANEKTSKVVTLDDAPASVPTSTSAEKVTSGAAITGSNHDAELSGRKVRVTFFEQEGDLGHDAIFIGLNGFGYNIPRGVPVDIPVEVLEIANNAITRVVSTAVDGSAKERDVMRFSFQVHGEIVNKIAA